MGEGAVFGNLEYLEGAIFDFSEKGGEGGMEESRSMMLEVMMFEMPSLSSRGRIRGYSRCTIRRGGHYNFLT